MAAAPMGTPPARPAADQRSLRQWVRDNLFSTWWNSLLTLTFAPLLALVIYRVGRFVFVDGEWEIIKVNLRLLLVWRFPSDQMWRLWTAMFLMAGMFALAAGAVGAARAAAIAEGTAQPIARPGLLRRTGPVIVLVALLLWLGRSVTALILVAAGVIVTVGLRWLGARLPRQSHSWTLAAAFVAPVAAFVLVTSFGGVPWASWGGLLLTLGLAAGGIVISYPLGVLLALGRRSSLPAVRAVCVAYIELIRGVPLIALLFMGFFMLGFFLPPGAPSLSLPTRAIVVIVMFTAAYVAEVVRGGLQSIPEGQLEAAYAVGLSPFQATRLIVLPQALRAVIPATVGQFISLFKDTSLVSIIGLVELLGVAEITTSQDEFRGRGLIFETLVFAAFVYWVGSYTMSRESRLLERQLGVGER